MRLLILTDIDSDRNSPFLLGSGISFLAIASIVGDVILVHIHSRRRQYKRDKIDEKSFHSKEDETDILSEP